MAVVPEPASAGQFAQGVALDDPLTLFNASLDGNTRRAIDFHQDQQIEEDGFKVLIRSAVALNLTRAAGKSK